MAVQTVYNENMDAARAGMIANTEPSVLISRNAEDADGMGFGRAAVQGTADKGCKKTEAGDAAILGISVRERSVDADTDKFKQYDSVRLMTKGPIWVDASVAVDAGDPVWVTVLSGAFTNVDAGSSLTVKIANARWDTSTTGAALAVVRLA